MVIRWQEHCKKKVQQTGGYTDAAKKYITGNLQHDDIVLEWSHNKY